MAPPLALGLPLATKEGDIRRGPPGKQYPWLCGEHLAP